MLIEFSVTNYRSFRDPVKLSLVATDREPDDPRVVTVDTRGAKPLRLLRSAVIYGPNASGKSNLVKALLLMDRMVRGSRFASIDESVARRPFLLDPAAAREPTEFEAIFYQDGEQYTYGFAFDDERVQEEWLFEGRPRTRLLFHRTGPTCEWGRSWRGDRGFLLTKCAADNLLLTVAADRNHPKAQAVAKWFAKRLFVMDRSLSPSYTLNRVLISDEEGAQVAEYLRGFDLSLDRVVARKVALREVLDEATTPPVVREAFRDLAGTEDAFALRATVVRRRADGKEIEFGLGTDESAGTRRMVELSKPLLDAARDGNVFVIDEFDLRLHPLLSEHLLARWHAARRPEGQTAEAGQLILTTHNPGLLQAGLLRRDQVWLMDKDAEQQSTLVALAEYRNLRPEADLRSRYLSGRFGAIPVLPEV
ncbi:MAG: ATP-binding protein [Fimbriimonadaceae bacterium]|nr:ATP-binding protein [Fimbriimonadaceae bacterium]